ncbi:hypothetical protein B0J11DRAFT_508645 [Dendryphion nanum]|uniref:Uncharacterized protein n=1 Tax=Dendryphion nanum TaxID=256645 RepID=A0A9P9IHL4_9PLEO|nr:hypothetical protein B0J11DRAFT_508645 [Dendryphion nanum]
MTSDDKVAFSAREMETLALAWQCFESEPKIDYKKLAAIAGYTEGSAKTTMGNLRRKLKASAAQQGISDGAATPKTPKSGAGGRPKKRIVDDGEESPTKRKATPKTKKTVNKDIQDEDEEFLDVRVKKEEALGLQLDSWAYGDGGNSGAFAFDSGNGTSGFDSFN